MRLLVYYNDEFSEVDESELTPGLIDKINDYDARVLRFVEYADDDTGGHFEEFSIGKNGYEVVDTYSDTNDDDEEKERNKIIEGLRQTYTNSPAKGLSRLHEKMSR